jgi:hypothetical protein
MAASAADLITFALPSKRNPFNVRPCLGRYSFRNSRIGQIRLFVLRDLEGGFSEPFRNSAPGFIFVVKHAMHGGPRDAMRFGDLA